MKTKVLILHTSVGYGIKVTAQNIFERLQNSSEFEPRIEDLQTVEAGLFARLLEKVYVKLLDRASFLWGFLYDSKIVMAISLPLRKLVARFKSKHVLSLLREFQPAIVISTQTTATGIVAFLKSQGLYRGKLVVVFSDYHFHPFWAYPEVDLYLCSIPEQVQELLKRGVAKDNIALTGMFVSGQFLVDVPKEDAKTELGLLQSMPVVLLTSGGRARDAVKEIFLKLLRSPKSFQVVVVCGHNESLKTYLETISAPGNHPVKVFGFVENMPMLMSAADVLVGKTGGPTMAEATIKKLPMVITDARPGHELKNLEYLLSHSVVDFARIPREAVFLVEQILDGKLKRDWPKLSEAVVRPGNAVDLLSALNAIKPETGGIKVSNYQQSP